MRISFLLLFTFYFSLAKAQTPPTYNSADIYLQLKKLNVLGSVLYIAAHPDDENTRLLAYFSKEKQYRTGYMSLTRGDGGQNLIGDEQGIELGLIRTQELLAARRIDGDGLTRVLPPLQRGRDVVPHFAAQLAGVVSVFPDETLQ